MLWFVFIGDILFVGVVGCFDLVGCEWEMVVMFYDSLYDKLLLLLDDIEVFLGY